MPARWIMDQTVRRFCSRRISCVEVTNFLLDGADLSSYSVDSPGPNGRAELRKLTHKVQERKYRTEYNGLINELKAMLPPSALDAANVNKLGILREAAGYIRGLQNKLGMRAQSGPQKRRSFAEKTNAQLVQVRQQELLIQQQQELIAVLQSEVRAAEQELKGMSFPASQDSFSQKADVYDEQFMLSDESDYILTSDVSTEDLRAHVKYEVPEDVVPQSQMLDILGVYGNNGLVNDPLFATMNSDGLYIYGTETDDNLFSSFGPMSTFDLQPTAMVAPFVGGRRPSRSF